MEKNPCALLCWFADLSAVGDPHHPTRGPSRAPDSFDGAHDVLSSDHLAHVWVCLVVTAKVVLWSWLLTVVLWTWLWMAMCDVARDEVDNGRYG